MVLANRVLMIIQALGALGMIFSLFWDWKVKGSIKSKASKVILSSILCAIQIPLFITEIFLEKSYTFTVICFILWGIVAILNAIVLHDFKKKETSYKKFVIEIKDK